jgi:hypothetical protein
LETTDIAVPVYVHHKRTEWGRALLAWEREDKRGYLFEDGVLRTIAEPYYHLMKLSELDQTSLPDAFRQQISQMSVSAANGVLGRNRDVSPVFSVEEQAQLLVGKFPLGFAGDAWRKRHRGDGAKKQLKRHRDAAIAQARKVLDEAHLARAVTDHRHEALWEEICAVLQATDLVPVRDITALKQKIAATRSLTVALKALLHPEDPNADEENFGTRFATFVGEFRRALGSTPSWPLATSLVALHSPASYVCVHPTSLRQQSKWMGEKPIRSNKPNPRYYESACATANKLCDQLEQLGLAPVDLFDVYDFVRSSTTPSAKKRLEALRQSDLRNMAAQPKEDAEASSAPASSASATEDASADVGPTESEAA